ncbi:MAG: hypothetical protein HY666_05095 [Chloroflexi bacterium]|nr:hypothetical protein [Chloroflexota bacterium]
MADIQDVHPRTEFVWPEKGQAKTRLAMRTTAFLVLPFLAAVSILVLAACGQMPTSTPTRTVPSEPAASTAIPSTQAAAHMGERATVCGPVVDTRYATGSKGRPTFLNFDRPYPNHTFVVLIWESDRGNFPSNPESYYKGKQVCATGLIESYQGKPEIIAKTGSQLVLAR